MNIDLLIDRLLADEPLYCGDRNAAWADISGVYEELALCGDDPENLTGSDYMGLFTAAEMTALFRAIPVE